MSGVNGLIGLGVALLLLVAWALATARRPAAEVPDVEGYFDRWQPLHGGVDPRGNPWLRGWLRMGYVVARPLARRGVHPDVLTVGSIWLAAAVVVIATHGGRWQILAGWLLVFSGLGDTLDGAVAVATDRTSRWGYVLDSTVDRVNDMLYLLACWVVGAPAWLCISTALGVFLLEYLRARAGNAGGSEVGTVTVGERAMRVICCSIAVHWGGVFLGLATFIAVLLTAILAVATAVGLAQLVIAVRRDLLALPDTPHE